MGQTIKGFTVSLEQPISEEGAEKLAEAIQMIKGVIKVEPSVDTVDDHINRNMLKHEMRMKYLKFINEEF